jgi:alpha-amylase
VSDYKLDGLRVDTVPYVPKDFWTQFTQASGVYTVGEVFNGDMGYVAGYVGPMSSLLNYPTYFRLKDVFLQNQNMRYIKKHYDDWAA